LTGSGERVLEELRVRDLGVIEEVTVPLEAGMTALTGETGAGKTLLIGALQLLLGGRASVSVVRAGASGALVEARFLVGEASGDAPGTEEGERLVSRELPASGRGRAWLDGRMAPIAALGEAIGPLLDIHGQHEHQSLLSPAAQREALDEFDAIDASAVRDARRHLRALETERTLVGSDPAARAREVDVLRHQIREIQGAALGEGDEELQLEREVARLALAGAHRERAAAALDLLDSEAGASASEGLREATGLLGGFEALAAWDARLRAVLAEVADIASDLREVVDTWEDDPDRLAELQARQRLLGELRRKYGATLSAVRRFGNEASARLEQLERSETDAVDLDRRIEEERGALGQLEAELEARRAGAAPRFAAAVSECLHGLAMPGATFGVTVAGPAGDDVAFLLGANAGEAVQPLSRVASGGELSRTMLAIRLVALGGPATVVFDEVDAGVGGEAATALGRALAQLGRRRQVLVVTHLPQVAAQADRQVAVRKEVVAGRTLTTVTVLSEEERVVELSRMLSGSPHSETARAHAAELLARAGTDRSTSSGAAVV
jgi:DNA repair protein RecN (Recombination protein N)